MTYSELYTPYVTAQVLEGGVYVGLATCKKCGCCVMVSPHDTLPVLELHAESHGVTLTR